MIVPTVAGVVIGCLASYLIRKSKNRRGSMKMSDAPSFPIVSWNDQDKNPLPNDIQGYVLIWDGKEWSVVSKYSTPTYSKDGKRFHYGKEVKAWGYLPLEEEV